MSQHAERTRILFVDDETDIARLLCYRLEKEGYEVLYAQDGEEALALLERRPHLILLDLWLPGMNGYEVCAAVRADPRGADIPVIFFTASASELSVLAKKAKECGAQDHVIKPFNIQELLKKIKHYTKQ
jgi:CheY-like chemotaxis protein